MHCDPVERLCRGLVAKHCDNKEKSDPERLHGILSGKGYDSPEHYHGSAEFNTRAGIFLASFTKWPKKRWISDAVQCNRWSGVSGHAFALIFRQVDGRPGWHGVARSCSASEFRRRLRYDVQD
jgi:hypothetical protein